MEAVMHNSGFGRRATFALKVACMLVLASTTLAACGDENKAEGGGEGGGRSAAGKKGKPAKGAAAAAGKDKDTGRELAQMVFKDEDFVPSIRNRDPFQSYSVQFKAKAPDEMQRRVIMSTTAIEDMRLIAIVTGVSQPKAMLVDPADVGHVVERGDYIGRPKVVQATGSVSMAINWRVDRIRDNEVVLTQQDPTDPTRAALTKIIPLKDEVAQR
jgi:type IV pilus assembly protein PilP